MDSNDLENRFTYHAPRGENVSSFVNIRGYALDFAKMIDEFCPDSREKSLAITKLEEVVFWANASIARNSVED